MRTPTLFLLAVLIAACGKSPETSTSGAGPHPALDTEDPGDAGFTGSLIIAEFDSLEAATAWADADPYVDAGVFNKVKVKPYKVALP